MVEAGQRITDTRTREFGEEAMALMDASDEAGRKVIAPIAFVSVSRSCAREQAIEERLARVFGAEPHPDDYLCISPALFYFTETRLKCLQVQGPCGRPPQHRPVMDGDGVPVLFFASVHLFPIIHAQVAILTLLEGDNARLELKAGDDAAKARCL